MITLTQYVLATLATYVIRTTLIPKGVSDKIEELMRSFVRVLPKIKEVGILYCGKKFAKHFFNVPSVCFCV